MVGGMKNDNDDRRPATRDELDDLRTESEIASGEREYRRSILGDE